MTWGGIKKGDAVIEVYGTTRYQHRAAVATSVGKKWITVDSGTRYQADNGYGEYGWSLHTEATLDERNRRDRAESAIRGANLRDVSTDRLVRIVAILDEVTP